MALRHYHFYLLIFSMLFASTFSALHSVEHVLPEHGKPSLPRFQEPFGHDHHLDHGSHKGHKHNVFAGFTHDTDSTTIEPHCDVCFVLSDLKVTLSAVPFVFLFAFASDFQNHNANTQFDSLISYQTRAPPLTA